MIRTEGRWRGGKTIRVYPAYGHRPGDAVPDRRPITLPSGGTRFEALVASYRAGYPPDERRDWIEARLRAWQAGQP